MSDPTAPKSGGLLDGVCHPIVKVPPQAAPVSAGAGDAVRTTPVTAAVRVSTKAMVMARVRVSGLDNAGSCGALLGGGRLTAAIPV